MRELWREFASDPTTPRVLELTAASFACITLVTIIMLGLAAWLLVVPTVGVALFMGLRAVVRRSNALRYRG